jgi:hypothetical protein
VNALDDGGCGQITCDRLIYWNRSDENNTQIWMHVACASSLIAGLAKDVSVASE